MTSSLKVSGMRIPSQAVIDLPGSKSHANRAIVCAAFADGKTVIKGATACDDVEVMVDNLRRLGFRLQWTDKARGILVVDGGIPKHRGSAVLDCHNAGTTLRFLTSVAAFLPGEWTVTGDKYMQKRLIGDLTKALRSLGAVIQDQGGCPPLRVQGGQLSGTRVKLKADVSSQYLSSLLLIAPVLPEGLTIELSSPLASSGYIDLTLKVMKDFGVTVKKESNTFIIHHQQYRSVATYQVEGDWSAAGAWLVLNAITGSTVAMPTLRTDSEQSDRELPSIIKRLRAAGALTIDCSSTPDQVMNLCVLAAVRKGVTEFTGIRNLRTKECDRIAVVATELRKAGMDIRERGDDLVIRGFGSLSKLADTSNDVTLDPHDDHRMAMCFALLGLLRGGIAVKNPDCVKKSYPSFFSDLETVLRMHRPITVVGMRGVGKSSLGRRLAAKLKSVHEDSDQLFEKQHGAIRAFIEQRGWKEFRQLEEDTIARALRPGIILSLGGGALTAPSTRKLVRFASISVWLQATEKELIKRLGNAKRPRLTDLPLQEEIRKFLLERGPHYREVASMEVSPSIRFGEQVPWVQKTLRRIFLGLPPPRR